MANATFFNVVRETVFGGTLTQAQVDGFNVIIRAWEQMGDGDPRKLAYILATTYHETARTMQPVRETLAKTDAKAKEILTKAWKAGKLPWVKRDYWSSGYFGRGYVQLTWRDNYAKAGKKLGIDLVHQPELALQPSIAAHILIRGMMEGWFTGKKLPDYINAIKADYVEARRIVNGTDRAVMIAGYATKFEQALDQADFSAEKPAQPRKPTPAPTAPAKPEKAPSGPVAAIVAGLIAIGAALYAILKAIGAPLP